jgi:hypothetical protein
MQDLNVIIKQNNEAVINSVPGITASGKFAVVEKAGVTVVNVYSFDTEQEAQAKAAEIGEKASQTATIVPPTSA